MSGPPFPAGRTLQTPPLPCQGGLFCRRLSMLAGTSVCLDLATAPQQGDFVLTLHVRHRSCRWET